MSKKNWNYFYELAQPIVKLPHWHDVLFPQKRRGKWAMWRYTVCSVSTGNSTMGRSTVRSVNHGGTHCSNAYKKVSHVKSHRLFNCSLLPNLQKEVDVQEDALSSSTQFLTCILSTDVKDRVRRRHIGLTDAIFQKFVYSTILYILTSSL